jgi:hypothetical protein
VRHIREVVDGISTELPKRLWFFCVGRPVQGP